MMGIFQKIQSIAKNRTTYRVGLLQAKAYRILKQSTAELLKPHGLSTFEWAFVGLLADNDSMRPKDAAYELGVEAPFVTQMVAGLKKKGLVQEARDKEDTRAKAISLTARGHDVVSKLEPIVRAGIRPLLGSISARDLLGYLTVLETIATNAEKQHKKK